MNIWIPIKQQVDKCRQIIRKWFPENKNEVTKSLYTPLSPTDSAEDCEVYFDALSWALSNKKQIKNIAISGPYGSGKSSIPNIHKERKTTVTRKR